MPIYLSLLLAAAGVLCVLLSTLIGVSRVSDWLLDAAQGCFIVGVIVFTAYIFSGMLRDARVS